MSKQIKVLSQPGCGKCVMVKKMFKADNVDFEEVNIRKQPEYVEKFGISSTPVTLLLDSEGNEISRINGFDRDALKKLGKEVA